jgi:hypothetical protein
MTGLPPWLGLREATTLILQRFHEPTAAAYEAVYRNLGSSSQRRDREGWSPAQRLEAGAEHLMTATRHLLAVLTNGTVSARGVWGDNNRSGPISSDDWTRAQAFDPFDDFISVPSSTGAPISVSSIRVSTEELMRSMPQATVVSTGSAERRAEKLLTELLRAGEMLKSDARAAVERAAIEVSGRGFEERVWPNAREAAGLPRIAPAGRPKRAKISEG